MNIPKILRVERFRCHGNIFVNLIPSRVLKKRNKKKCKKRKYLNKCIKKRTNFR